HYITGKVTLLEDENLIRIEAETNLIEGAQIDVRFGKAYGMLSSISSFNINQTGGEIDSNGQTTIDLEMKDHFFDKTRGSYTRVDLIAESTQFEHVNLELMEAYGSDGEHFKGPLV